MEQHKVLIRKCAAYDPDQIAAIVREGMEELGVVPKGKVLLKPNVVRAHPKFFTHAFTRKEFLDGVLTATKARADGMKELAVGERSGITMPTRYDFKMAGYPSVIRKHGAKIYYFDEVRQVPVMLKKEGRLRDLIFIPQPIKECDFLISLPKFKAHPWTRLTLSLKNFIGIQDDRHRLIDHNSYLEHKIVDLQEVIQPRFIAVDAITAGQKMMLTPTPFDLGAIVMGTNSCAVDTVGCHMVRVDPKDLLHLKMASERGYGPMELAEIEVGGDFPLEEIQEKTKDFQFCLERIDDYFPKGGRLNCTIGTFPEKHSTDYCWGGCPGALQEAVHILRSLDPEVEKKMQKIRYVMGKVSGPLNLEPDERVIFVGNCTSWQGNLDGEAVKIESTYQPRSARDTHNPKSNDLMVKTVADLWDCFRTRKSRYAQIKGCTVSVAQHVNYLASLGGIKNPVFDPRLSIGNTWAYWQMRAGRAMNRLLG
jgi:uncharacterized protein (DUF362 family)